MSKDITIDDLEKLKDFLKWRKTNPEEWKEFKEELKTFYIELKELLEEVFVKVPLTSKNVCN